MLHLSIQYSETGIIKTAKLFLSLWSVGMHSQKIKNNWRFLWSFSDSEWQSELVLSVWSGNLHLVTIFEFFEAFITRAPAKRNGLFKIWTCATEVIICFSEMSRCFVFVLVLSSQESVNRSIGLIDHLRYTVKWVTSSSIPCQFETNSTSLLLCEEGGGGWGSTPTRPGI